MDKDNLTSKSGMDENIREKIKQKDMDLIKQVHKDLEREEKELKSFFKELREPTKEDPTLTRKKRYEEKMNAYRQVVEGLDFKSLLRRFWTFIPATPEEIETLNDCRRVVKKNILLHSLGGFAVTSGVSYYYRRELPRSVKLLGIFVGVLGGGMMGIIRSTEYTLKRFEGLGADYDLGRLAITEIDEFRTDKKKAQAA